MSDQQNRPYIQSAHIGRYKSILDLNLELKPGLNIIIGPNGSGKTNLLQALNMGTSELSPYWDKSPVEGISIQLGSLELNKPLRGLKSPFPRKGFDKRLPIFQGRILSSDLTNQESREEYTYPTYSGIIPHGIATDLLLIENSGEMRITTNPKSQFGFFPSAKDTLLPNSNFVAELYWDLFMLLSQDDIPKRTAGSFKESLIPKWDMLNDKVFSPVQKTIQDLRAYTPITDIRLSPQFLVHESQLEGEYLLSSIFLEYYVNGTWHPYSQLSDGTKRILQIVLQVSDPEVPIIFLEEPELGIHPHQLHLLLKFLKEKAQDTQIIITTHAPQVLDIISEKELDRILISSFDPKKGSRFKRLTQQEQRKAKSYMKDLQLSDYWRFSDLEPQNIH